MGFKKRQDSHETVHFVFPTYHRETSALTPSPMSMAQDPFFLNHHLQMASVAAEGHNHLTPPHTSRSVTPAQSTVKLLVNFSSISYLDKLNIRHSLGQ